MTVRVYLNLKCEDRFVAQARYVFSAFCKVLGVDLIEDARISDPADGVTVWYEAGAAPRVGPGLIWIPATEGTLAFFRSDHPRRAGEVLYATWKERRVPFLFGPVLGSAQTEPLDSLLASGADGVYMPYDLIASAFYFLSRWEETVIPDRDQHGRFPYVHSLAAELDLGENIVDMYLDLFIAMLNAAGDGHCPQVEIPTWDGGLTFVACLTHDVDEIRKSRPSRLKFVWDHLTDPVTGHRYTPIGDRARLALSTLLSRRDPYWTFPVLSEIERQFGFNATYFFQAGGRKEGSRYSLSEARVRDFIEDLLDDGFEVGLHGTYWSAFDEARFLQEKQALASVIREEPLGHRQHYLRMDYANTLPMYERAGVRYDATLGFAEHEGYRNQFSYPFHPYNHEANRPFCFLELPTVIMDATLGGYRELPAEGAWQVIEEWLARTLARRGCITLLWHNPWDGTMPGYFDLYPRILAWIRDHGGVGLSGRDVLHQWLVR